MAERNTNQKLQILDCIRSLKTHPTAEEVHQLVKKKIPGISLATIYRNLNKFASKGEILRIEVNKEFHYDYDLSTHQHLICEGCGSVQDAFNENISKYAMEKAKSSEFKINSVNIMFLGRCKNCMRT
jgi:Fur family transcriptional regulator, ferric uptake regulator